MKRTFAEMSTIEIVNENLSPSPWKRRSQEETLSGVMENVDKDDEGIS